MNYVLIFIGGGAGASLRHAVNVAALRSLGPGYPYGTIAVNVVGSFAMGLFIGWLVGQGGSQGQRLFVATGLLGGFTTFSAFSLDFANLWERGEVTAALTYAAGTVFVSILALFAGLWLTRV